MTKSLERAFKRLKGSLDPEVALMSGNWAIGATGAVGAQVGATGLTLARTGTGTYTAQIKGLGNVAARVPAILHPWADVVTSDADPTDDTAAFEARVISFVASTGLITLQTFDEGGVAADPASGAFLCVSVLVRMSSATR